jgi:hypothetical protein
MNEKPVVAWELELETDELPRKWNDILLDWESAPIPPRRRQWAVLRWSRRFNAWCAREADARAKEPGLEG